MNVHMNDNVSKLPRFPGSSSPLASATMRQKSPPRRVTLKDIARKMDCTVNTVSRALKDKDDIGLETRRRIQTLAQRMGYIGNAAASSMRSGRTHTVAIVIGDISNPFFAICVKELETVLRQRHYGAFVLNTDEDAAEEQAAVRAALGRNVDGVILCPSGKEPSALNLLRLHRKPFVLMGRLQPELEGDAVGWDNRRGGYLATQHLLAIGRRRILHLAGPDWIADAVARRQGYRDAIQEFGLPLDAKLEAGVVITAGQGCYDNICRILDEVSGFDAIFAFSDVVAWTAMTRLAELQLRVPADVAVAGFDDVQSYLHFPCPLTSIGVPMREPAAKIVELLMARIEAPDSSPAHREMLEPRLIVRGSTVAPLAGQSRPLHG